MGFFGGGGEMLSSLAAARFRDAIANVLLDDATKV